MQDPLSFLNQRIDYERIANPSYTTRAFKLGRMRELVRRIGEPQVGMPTIHVAGTKGKGSTSAMAAAVLTAAGYRTGLFTSPHIERVEERIAIDGRPCSSAEFAALLEQLAPVIEVMDREAAALTPPEPGPTYFEVLTAMALMYFARQKADSAVLEVGLGGRLDSTNVCEPWVTVITSISLDHTKQLGDTPEAIAGEKAGIIKPGVPVISGVVEPGPREVIRRTCREAGSRLVELGSDFQVDYTPPRHLESSPGTARIDFQCRGPAGVIRHSDVPLGLLGRHQAINASLALAALTEFRCSHEAGKNRWEIPEAAIRQGLGQVTWPARIELIARRPAVIVDAAHNVASAAALVEVLNASFSAGRRILVFATTLEKDIRGMLEVLLREFDHVILTQYLDSPRAVPVEELAAMATEISGRSYPAYSRPADAWDAAHKLAAPDDLICVTGSFFIAAQIRCEVLARPSAEGPSRRSTY